MVENKNYTNIIILVGIPVLFILVGFIYYLVTAVPQRSSDNDIADPTSTQESLPPINNQIIETMRNAIMSLVSDKTELKVGETGSFDIIIDSNTHAIVGVDSIIIYDSEFVENIIIKESGEFDMYPGKRVTETEIMFSGLFNIGTSKKGVFNLGTVSFTAKKPGNVEFAIKYTYMDTTDSNIVEDQNSIDVLREVNNITFNIVN
jgi:hypothetical protein